MKYVCDVTVEADSVTNIRRLLDTVDTIILHEFNESGGDVSMFNKDENFYGKWSFMLSDQSKAKEKEDTQMSENKAWSPSEALEEMRNGMVISDGISKDVYKIARLIIPDTGVEYDVVIGYDPDMPDDIPDYIESPSKWVLSKARFGMHQYIKPFLTAEQAEGELLEGRMVEDVLDEHVYFSTMLDNPLHGDRVAITFVIDDGGDPTQYCLTEDFVLKMDGRHFRVREEE